MPDLLHPTPYADVNAMLDDFRAYIAALLRDNFVGM
jgi:hypothetical protein